MKPLKEFTNRSVQYVFTDIDDTLTRNGLLQKSAFSSIWQLYEKGVNVIPITGRPAGWCELIARQWPVAGVIGENGGLYFRYHQRQMKRYFVNSQSDRIQNQKKLAAIQAEVLKEVPGSAVASDQFCRMLDLAIDFCEDVEPLPETAIKKIVSIFEKHGATAKVSSIHVNGWFGDYNKLSTCAVFMQNEFEIDIHQQDLRSQCAFVGDSPNDEPMFEFFENSFAVANIKNFVSQLKHLPQYVASSEGGDGFSEVAVQILGN